MNEELVSFVDALSQGNPEAIAKIEELQVQAEQGSPEAQQMLVAVRQTGDAMQEQMDANGAPAQMGAQQAAPQESMLSPEVVQHLQNQQAQSQMNSAAIQAGQGEQVVQPDVRFTNMMKQKALQAQ